MSHITVGYTDSGSHRRQIKPPGGGYSDIFGTGDTPHENINEKKNEPIKKSVDNSVVKKSDQNYDNGTESSFVEDGIDKLIIEERSESSVTVDINGHHTTEKHVEHTKQVSHNGNTQSSSVDNKIGDSKKTGKESVDGIFRGADAAAPSKRTRIPPGGYSSGLW